jgi:signal transduction histidine kinase
MEQALTNLLTNAGKYTPPGGRVEIAARRDGDRAVVTVSDNGIGIRPEMLPRVFDLFQQADRVPGRVSEGLGLGLTLVRTLIEMHGGTVEAASGVRATAARLQCVCRHGRLRRWTRNPSRNPRRPVRSMYSW